MSTAANRVLKASMTDNRLMPTLFLSHGGGPCFFMNDTSMPVFKAMGKTSPMANFLRSVVNNREWIPRPPKAIVVISAHWEEAVATVSYQAKGTSLIYDYYGFPENTYAPHLTWPAPTDLTIADSIVELLKAADIPCSKKDRGFDHGVFIPLKLAIPDASIPVVQVSLQKNLDPKYHIRLGEALAPLRQQNVLIIGSGATTHNLGDIMSTGTSQVAPHVQRFTDWLYRTLALDSADPSAIARSRSALEHMHSDPSIASDLQMCHPRTEHLIPLHVAYGAGLKYAGSCTNNVSAGGDANHMGSAESGPVLGKRIFQHTVGAFALDCYMFQ